MNKKRPTFREDLIKICEKINSYDLSKNGLSNIASWGSEPDKLLKIVTDQKLDRQDVPDREFRLMVKSYVSNNYNITTALLSRLMLIQTSCKKINSGWYGVSSDINEFRFIAERYATLFEIVEKFKQDNPSLQIQKNKDVFLLSDHCLNSSKTRFDWSNLLDKKFEDMKTTEYTFDEKNELVDMRSKSIFSAIDRVQKKRMPGLRNVYDFCCEFVHPNIGDAVATGLDLTLVGPSDGLLLRKRKLSAENLIELDDSATGESKLIQRTYEFATRILIDIDQNIPQMIGFIKDSRKLMRNFVHKVVKRQRNVFDKRDLCPCGSGRSVQNCVYRKVI